MDGLQSLYDRSYIEVARWGTYASVIFDLPQPSRRWSVLTPLALTGDAQSAIRHTFDSFRRVRKRRPTYTCVGPQGAWLSCLLRTDVDACADEIHRIVVQDIAAQLEAAERAAQGGG